MKQLRILFVIQICVLYFASSSVIDTDSQVGRECLGSMKLQRLSDDKILDIDSKRIRAKGRGRRSISHRGMRFAEVSGSCCWEVRDRKYGGDFMHLKTVENHSLPWEIKMVKLIECYST